MPPDPLPEDILDPLRSFHRSFNQQSTAGVLSTFIDDTDPVGPPGLGLEGGVFIGQADIAQALSDFFAAHPDAVFVDICLVTWAADLDTGEAAAILLSTGVTNGMTVELKQTFALVRRGDWLIRAVVIEDDGEGELECLAPLSLGNPVGGVTASTNKLAVAAPYLLLAGLLVVVSTIYIMSRRKD